MSEGSTVVPAQGQQERKQGIAYVRQDEVRGLSGVAVTALTEAHRIACEVNIAMNRQDRPVEVAEIVEALMCVEAADHHLRMLHDTLAAVNGNGKTAFLS